MACCMTAVRGDIVVLSFQKRGGNLNESLAEQSLALEETAKLLAVGLRRPVRTIIIIRVSRSFLYLNQLDGSLLRWVLIRNF